MTVYGEWHEEADINEKSENVAEKSEDKSLWNLC